MGTPDSPPDAAPHQPWVTATADALAPEGSGRYANFPGGDDEAHARSIYPGGTGERLAAIKRRYDPDDLLRRAINVPPAATP